MYMLAHSMAPLPDAAETRERILSAAYCLFRTLGVDATPTRRIAREAGVNEVTLFRHFKTKAGLLKAVVGRFAPADIPERLRALRPAGSLIGDLRALAELILSFHEDHEEFFRFVLVNLACHPEQREFFNRFPPPAILHWGRRFFVPYCRPSGLDAQAVSLAFAAPVALRSIRKVFTGRPHPFPEERAFLHSHVALFARLLSAPAKERR